MKKLLRVMIGVAALVGSSAYADEVKTLPLTPEDLAAYLGVNTFKWSYEIKEPCNEVTLKLLHCTRAANGTFEKVALNTFRSGKHSSLHDVGLYPITIMIGKETMGSKFFGTSSTGSFHSAKDFESSFSKPRYIDGEYILMANAKNNSWVSENAKDDMTSYLCVRIESKMIPRGDKSSSE